jgi:hypothetical protein
VVELVHSHLEWVIPKLTGIVSQIEEEPHYAKFNRLCLQLAELRANAEDVITVTSRTATSIGEVLKLLRSCEALEGEYATWFEIVKVRMAFKPVAFVDSIEGDIGESIVYPGRIDSYDDLLVASTYNIARSCRLLIWSTILRCIAWLGEPQDYRLSPEFTVASRVCKPIIEDVIASIPYHFGWNNNGAVPMSKTAAMGQHNDLGITGVISTFVIWPVFTTLSSDFSTESQKLYLLGRLRKINEATGMGQTGIMIKRVSRITAEVMS